MYIIELRNIVKNYYMGKQTVPVLHGIDLKVKEGDFLAIMGPSGSGKSTLMNILGCLDRPTSGSYVLNGSHIESYDDEGLSHIRNLEIGFVFQNFNLLPDSSALQNISLPLVYRGVPSKIRHPQAIEAAEKIGIGERVRHKPTELSGGQAQRVAIARALIGNPGIILADEPTGNLDSKTGKEIMDLFLELHKQGHTIIMVTHDEKVALHSERIIHIKDGNIVKEQIIEKSAAQGQNNAQVEKKSVKHRFRWKDLVTMAIREGLLLHPLRTFLTMLGVVFGVAAVITMLAINEGARKKAIEQIQQMGLHNIRIRSLKMDKEEIREARKNLSMGLNLKDLKAIQAIPTVKFAIPIRLTNAEISYKNFKPKVRVLATLPSYQKVANFYAEQGRFINAEDILNYRRICILGRSIKQELFANKDALGQKIYIGSEIFTVQGIMEGKNLPQGVVKTVSAHDLNHNIYIPLSTAQKRFKNSPLMNELDEISLMVKTAEEVRPTAQLLGKLLKKRHNSVSDFEIVVPEELLEQSRKTQEIFDIVMVCIASISLIVGGIGIMNIMLATVTERIREIGIRRAVGASRQNILRQFLVESVAISMVGGLVGLTFGWILSEFVSFYTGWQTLISITSIALGFGVSSIVGIIFGIYPAWKAALLDPIKALNTT